MHEALLDRYFFFCQTSTQGWGKEDDQRTSGKAGGEAETEETPCV